MSGMLKKSAFHGSWRITETEVWSRKDIDLEKPAYIEFAGDRMGEFHLLFVHGWMDCRYGTRDGKPGVEFSWEGIDEGNQCSGRGWAVLEADRLDGRLFFHDGDDSGFTAERQKEGKNVKRRV